MKVAYDRLRRVLSALKGYDVRAGWQAGCLLLRGFSREQRLPARLDHPVDDPRGMSLAQRSNRWKGVQDVSHGAKPNHEQAKVGLRLQALIFSQGAVRRSGCMKSSIQFPAVKKSIGVHAPFSAMISRK
jgi:hypothetical protein